jgi:glycosyltransferase involved in cell wall biosynthesis
MRNRGNKYRTRTHPEQPIRGEQENSKVREEQRNLDLATISPLQKPTKTKDTSSSSPLITINGMVYTNDSFSIVTRGLTLGLLQNGYKVSIDAWSDGNRSLPIEPEVRKAVRRGTDNNIGIRISHPNSFATLQHYKHKIGKGYFETNIFPNEPQHNWVKECNIHCDQLWVSSEFNKEVCEKSGVENAFVVHDGFDDRIYNIRGNKYKLPFDADTFVFLAVGNSQKRKGTDLIYEAFTQEFTKGEKVAVFYKSYAPWAWGAARYARNGWNPELAKKHDIPLSIDDRIYHFGRIDESLDPVDNKWKPILVDASIPYTEMGSLYRAADCFLLPSYGEGAGICNLEAMACGTPVITSNWSAHLDFCNNKNSYLVEGTHFEKAFEQESWQGEWLVPSIDQLKLHMRYVYEHPDMTQIKTKQALKDVQNFTWKKCAREAIITLSLLVPEIGKNIQFDVVDL